MNSCAPRPAHWNEADLRATRSSPDRSDRSDDTLLADTAALHQFVAEIRQLKNTPYRWGGGSQDGLDCSGLVVTLYRNVLGLRLPHSTEQLYEMGQKIPLKNLTFGDLVFFSTSRSRWPSHMGFYLADGWFVHASSSSGVIYSRLDEKPYARSFLGARRVWEKSK